MKRIVAYGTQEGHTAKIAEFAGAVARAGGCEAELRACANLPADFDVKSYGDVILAAPMRNRKYEANVVEFARRHRAALESVPSAFLSVGLIPLLPRFLRGKAVAGVIDNFARETGWRPGRVLPVGGALLYRAYSLSLRRTMRISVALLGGPTDTSRNHELTDCEALKEFIRAFLAALSDPAATGKGEHPRPLDLTKNDGARF